MRSGTEQSQLLRVSLPTLLFLFSVLFSTVESRILISLFSFCLVIAATNEGGSNNDTDVFVLMSCLLVRRRIGLLQE